MLARHRILIVDDNAVDRQAVVQALQREAAEIDGIEADVLEVDTISGAREAIGREEFSCVFLNHELPDGTSLDLLMEVRAQGLITPVVVLTGQRDVQSIVEVMHAGAVDYLPKEKLHPDLIVRSLRAALLFHQTQREKQRVLDEIHARDRAIAAAPNGIVIADPHQLDCPLVYVNEAFLRMTGYEEAEVLGRNCRFLQGEDTDPTAVQEMHEAIRQERSCQVTLLNYRKDGTAFFSEVFVSPVRDSKGTLTHFVGIQSDVTDRHEADAERRQAEEERERQGAVLAAAYRREALLNRIGLAVRQALPPEEVERTALAGLGEALGADRCLSIITDTPSDSMRFGSKWRRSDLPPLASGHRLSDFDADLAELFPVGRTLSVSDTRAGQWSSRTTSMMARMRIRSLVCVPFTRQNKVVGVLGVYMSGAPRQWTDEEVSLVEAVASQLSAATEAARLRQREHNIAEQLQAALQPNLPEAVPGLKVTKWYEPALTDEAGVGGDFYDVFAVEKGCTVLVVGDLSGKGLIAATNVSIVRNMLRAFLYSKPTVAEAMTELNRVLAENNLLTGFATLFVGAYEGGTRVLNYVNCGQEPALVRRAATRQVEHLQPTGPILGSIENAQYTEKTLTLARGDALAIFSDGLTEIGPSRTAMLGIEGVAALLGEPIPEDNARDAAARADYLAQHLIAGVDAVAAGGVMRDDVCLLVAVVE